MLASKEGDSHTYTNSSGLEDDEHDDDMDHKDLVGKKTDTRDTKDIKEETEEENETSRSDGSLLKK